MSKKDKLIENTINLMNEEKHELYEMARIGFTDDGFEVYINTDDGGNIPHFHYRRGKYPNYDFHTCIRLDEAEYFHPEGKEGRLNSKQKKDLLRFLNSINKDEDKTNWQILLIEWNRNNFNIRIDKNQKMLNYLNLK